jgi:hypothetical protein
MPASPSSRRRSVMAAADAPRRRLCSTAGGIHPHASSRRRTHRLSGAYGGYASAPLLFAGVSCTSPRHPVRYRYRSVCWRCLAHRPLRWRGIPGPSSPSQFPDRTPPRCCPGGWYSIDRAEPIRFPSPNCCARSLRQSRIGGVRRTLFNDGVGSSSSVTLTAV